MEEVIIQGDAHPRIRQIGSMIVAQGTADHGTLLEIPNGKTVEEAVWIASPYRMHAPKDVATTQDNWTHKPIDGCSLQPDGDTTLKVHAVVKAKLHNRGPDFDDAGEVNYLIFVPAD